MEEKGDSMSEGLKADYERLASKYSKIMYPSRGGTPENQACVEALEVMARKYGLI